ncbi:MAG: EAL domain-containing protein [Ruminococcus sp.]|nr:EAL domain-containing protein [Ruminococcus sp.]
MLAQFQPYIPHYSYVGDIVVIALCIVILILLRQTFLRKNSRFRILLALIALLCGAAYCSLMYHSSLEQGGNHLYIHLFRLGHNLLLTIVLDLYIQYLHEPLWVPNSVNRQYLYVSVISLVIIIGVDFLLWKTQLGFYIDNDGMAHSGFNVFIILYVLFTVSLFFIIIKHRSRIIRHIFYGLIAVNILSIILLSIQGFFNNTSFTTVSFTLPAICIIFMFHPNPYDIDTGAVSGTYLNSELSDCLSKGKDLLLMRCTMKDFSSNIRKSPELRHEYHKFFRQNVKKGILYHISEDTVLLTLRKQHNVDYEKLMARMIYDFNQKYTQFNMDYKILFMETTTEVIGHEDYTKILDFIDQKMSFNETHRVSSEDILEFYDSCYILSQLEDIAAQRNPDDERVVVYCQPVRNLETGMFDTAEALMRLDLPKVGIVYPDQFIHLAEQNNIIHWLSMVMLSKTCAVISDFLDEGLDIKRISVNFSVLDIRYDSFCTEVKSIIDRNDIPYDKIAVEITESRSDADFNVMKQRVLQLRELGIKFYLDDFGTGYSNFERIMEIPFDIIKFDRSLLIESKKDDSSHFMVSTFAAMFDKLNYSVLFEGVENDEDEEHCRKMRVKYLQGFNYSKPIPIEKLRKFLRNVPIR